MVGAGVTGMFVLSACFWSLFFSVESSDNLSWLAWTDIFNMAEVEVVEEQCEQLEIDSPVSGFLRLGHKYQDYILRDVRLENSAVARILHTCLCLQKDPTFAKRQCVEKNVRSPSEVAKIKGWKTFKKKAPHVYCHRSPKPLHGFPVTLQVKAFGDFVDALKVDADLSYRRMALDLMVAMTKIYDDETQRQSKLQSIFMKYGFIVRPFSNLACLSFCGSSDGKVVANIVVKNELGFDGKNPNLQNIAYYVHITKDQRQEQSNPRQPMLLLSLCGCDYFQVFGATWNGGTVTSDPLTSPLSLLYVPDNTESIEALARVLSALQSAVTGLDSCNENDTGYPYFNDNSRLKYVCQVHNRNLFRAKLQTGSCEKDVMVKFVKRYGRDVHEYLADMELAPKLHKVELLPGGWKAVIMDEVKGSDLAAVPQHHLKLVAAGYNIFYKTLIEKLQQKNFVHGDLRPQNIILSDTNTFALVDFDWAGECGIVKYPLDINPECGWAPGVNCGVLIESGHDRYQLENLLSQM